MPRFGSSVNTTAINKALYVPKTKTTCCYTAPGLYNFSVPSYASPGPGLGLPGLIACVVGGGGGGASGSSCIDSSCVVNGNAGSNGNFSCFGSLIACGGGGGPVACYNISCAYRICCRSTTWGGNRGIDFLTCPVLLRYGCLGQLGTTLGNLCPTGCGCLSFCTDCQCLLQTCPAPWGETSVYCYACCTAGLYDNYNVILGCNHGMGDIMYMGYGNSSGGVYYCRDLFGVGFCSNAGVTCCAGPVPWKSSTCPGFRCSCLPCCPCCNLPGGGGSPGIGVGIQVCNTLVGGCCAVFIAGNWGGWGGYAKKYYNVGDLTPSSTVVACVGSGGNGGTGFPELETRTCITSPFAPWWGVTCTCEINSCVNTPMNAFYYSGTKGATGTVLVTYYA